MNEQLDNDIAGEPGQQQAGMPSEKDRLRAAKHHGIGSDPEHLDAEMEDPSQVAPSLPATNRDDLLAGD